MAGGSRPGGRSVIAGALAILGAFDEQHRHLSLSQLARRAELPVSTASRLVGELVARQALARRPDASYEIGHWLWRLGLLAPVQQELREVALPFLHDVHAATGDVVHLAVRDGASALYVASVVGSGSVTVVSRTGTRLPLHATGVGKVLLAQVPPSERTVLLSELARVTVHTIVEPGRLGRELVEVRRRGWARTAEEMTLGTCSVAVPVPGRVETARPDDVPVVAALGIVVHSVRRDLSRLVPTLRVAASGIGRAWAQPAIK